MSALIVTGGAGFIGCNLVRALLRATGDRIVVFDRLTYAGGRENLADLADDPRVELVVGDVADAEAVAAVLDAHRPRGVFHLAAETHVDRSIDAPHAFVRTNVLGTQVLLEQVRRYLERPGAPDGFRLVQVSTDEVYGSLPEGRRADEQAPFAPSSPYAASKASADLLAHAWHVTWDLPVIVTHATNNYGPFQFPEKLIPLMLLNALEGRALPLYGDGLQRRDWIHVEDHCDGLIAAFGRGVPGRRYNLGTGVERTNLEVVETLCAILERLRPAAASDALARAGVASYRELITHVADRPGHDRRYAVDVARARNELGFAPRIPFGEGLERTVRWYLEHRDWCAAVEARGYRRERLGLGGRDPLAGERAPA
ncbi:MAG: dTDP-glucose 4,6-dehydratase [Acidobacteria bacterium]|nr:MAG: dTDP-glucose 4,6-dehydratase [Acidobacteriota bacterium]